MTRSRKKNTFARGFADGFATVGVYAAAITVAGAFILGIDWLIFKGLQFVWHAYPLNYWQTVVAMLIIGVIANMFRSTSSKDD